MFEIQKWFATSITQPLGQFESDNAAEIIKPNFQLTSAERLKIYHEQYWWRIIKLLRETFPLTAAFKADFDQTIAIPYFVDHPPDNWSLVTLGNRLPLWIQQKGFGEIFEHASTVDFSFQTLFYVRQPTEVTPTPELLSQKLRLQEHLKLFQLPYDLFQLRGKKSLEIPPRGNIRYFLLFRNLRNYVSYLEVSEAHYVLLRSIEGGMTIEEACDHLAPNLSEEADIENWIQIWLGEKWLMTS